MNWKAYEEINFGNDIIYRWVREGEEYVSRMTLEQMDEFESKIRQQQAEIEALKKEAALQRLSDFTQEATKTLTDDEILEIANQSLVGATAWHNPDLDPINFARAILRKAQEK